MNSVQANECKVYQGSKHRFVPQATIDLETFYTLKQPEPQAKGYWACTLTHPYTEETKSVILIVGSRVPTSAHIGPMLYRELVKTNNLADFLSKPFSLTEHGWRVVDDEDLIPTTDVSDDSLLFVYNHETCCWERARVKMNRVSEEHQTKMLPANLEGGSSLLSIQNHYTDSGVFRTIRGTTYLLCSDTVSTANRLSFLKQAKRTPSKFKAYLVSGKFSDIPKQFQAETLTLTPFSAYNDYHLDTTTGQVFYTPFLEVGKLTVTSVVPRRTKTNLDLGVCTIELPRLDKNKYHFMCGEVLLSRDRGKSTFHIFDSETRNCVPNKVKHLIEKGLLVEVS